MSKADTKKKPASSATRAESARAFQAARTPEERAESARKAQAARTPEQRAAIAAKAAATRAENAAKKKARQEAAAKGVATKRERYPEKFKAPPPPEKKKRRKKGAAAAAPRVKDPRRVAAGLKGAATKKRNEAARLEAARQMREGIEGRKRETGADWRSELTYISGPGVGSLGEWVRELFRAIVEDTESLYRPGKDPRAMPPGLLEIPWRVQGGIQGAPGGGAVFDLVVEGTSHERAAALIAAVVAAGERAGIFARDRYKLRAVSETRGPRAAKPMNAAAEAARAEALAKYAREGDVQTAARIETMTAPAYSKVWGGVAEPDEDDDEDPIPF